MGTILYRQIEMIIFISVGNHTRTHFGTFVYDDDDDDDSTSFVFLT
jgi:hypothetical protein